VIAACETRIVTEVHRVRILPTRRGQGHLVHAHLEAHDHLAVATDLEDGSVEIVGPRELASEIDAVCGEIARCVGALVMTG
jgi:hypothetical protein